LAARTGLNEVDAMPRQPRVLAVIVVAGLLAAGCASVGPDGCAAQSVTLRATVTADAMDPSALTACRDQEVTLEIQAEADGEFHIHGYDEQLPAPELTAGEITLVEFTADLVGQFIIEFHPTSGGDEAEIGVLTVNEP